MESSPQLTDEPFVDPSVLLARQRELSLLRTKLALIKANGLSFYRPHEKQHLYHSSAAKNRGVFAGNRFGKSECDAAETVAWFIGERTWYKFAFPVYGVRDGAKVVVGFHEGGENHPLVRQGIPQHATKQLIITTDWKKVDEVWTSPLGDPPGKLWKFLPSDRDISAKRNHEGTIDQIFDKKSGAIIRFTTEQAFLKNPQSGESTDYDRIGVDEPIREDMWKAHSRGLIDRNGQGDFTLTSLRERWIFDFFFPSNRPSTRPDRWAVRATMNDNPFLTAEAKERYLSQLTDEERECRELGIPLEFSGLVYKEFDGDSHILKSLPKGWTSWDSPPADHTIYCSIDVHSQTPQAALFVAVPPMGAPIIYDEIWRKCVADELAEEVLRRLAGRTIGFIKCDPRAWEEDPVYRCSMAQRFFALGLYVEKSSKAKDFGINNMRSVLKKRPHAVWFAPSLTRTLWEISRYHFDKENRPIDADDHFMECMYRIFINTLSHIDPTDSRPVPDFDIPITRSAIAEFDVDSKRLLEAVGFNN